jgi:alpha-tubulin suppressor-like RCC1 family protein
MSRSGLLVALLCALSACSSDTHHKSKPTPGHDAGHEADAGDGDGDTHDKPDAGSHDEPDAGNADDGGSSELSVSVSVDPNVICTESCLMLNVGDTRQMVATVTDKDGKTVDIPVTWSTADITLATVDDKGLVTATGAGDVDIRASAQGAKGSATLHISAASITRIEVDPSDVKLDKVGDTKQLTAKAYDANGVEVKDAAFVWFSSNEKVLKVDASGLVSGVGRGTAFVWVTVDGNSEGQVHVVVESVLPAGHGLALAEIAGASTHACGTLSSNGKAYCWGWNYYGELGNGTVSGESEYFPTPLAVKGDHLFHGLTGSESHTCALEADGTAYCWGYNGKGELGVSDPQVKGSPEPIAVEGGLKFAQIAAGYDHSCAIDAAGKAYCFGFNYKGAIGNGNYDDQNKPAAVSGNLAFNEVRAGLDCSCGLTKDGKAYCWGNNEYGQIGNGSDDTNATYNAPEAVLGDHVFTHLDLMASHACGITADGETWCWGRNESYQLGDDGDGQAKSTPVKVKTELKFVDISVGIWHSCGRTSDGDVHCWGLNDSGELGDGSITSSHTPVQVAGGLKFKSIDAGFFFVAGLTTDGEAFAWGENGEGQLGSGFGGEGSLSSVPWPVTAPE